MKTKKILLIDLETSPLICYTWGTYEQNALKVIKEWRVLCFAWKWLGDKKTNIVSLHEYGDDESKLVGVLWELFNQAEIVMAHNGDHFDVKKSNAKFIEHGLTPPSTYKTIDTLKVARQKFKFTSNRLDALGEHLGLGKKKQTGGFELWDKCMQGDDKAWRKMEAYCKQDVRLLEKVYLKLRPWFSNHPNMNLYNKTERCCPNCGSSKVQKQGYSYTRVNKFQRWKCLDCGSWHQSPLNNVKIR